MFERDGVKLVCDDISFDFLKGATVEFEENLIRSAFQVSVGLAFNLKQPGRAQDILSLSYECTSCLQCG